MKNEWIKLPGPGQEPGQGNWFLAMTEVSVKFYNECKRTGYLPTYEGERPPKDNADEAKESSEVELS